MMIDGGKIKEVKIKLLLSSRTEMQKVIEQARQQSVTLQTFMQMPAPPMTPMPSVPNMPSVMGQQIPQPHPHSQPQPHTQPQPQPHSHPQPQPHSHSQPQPHSHPPHTSMPPAMPQAPPTNDSIPATAAPVVAEVLPVIPDRREQEREQKERESDNVSITSNKDRRDRRERSRSRDKDGDRRSKRDRSRGRRDRDRDRNRRHRDRSNSRDRDRSDRNRRRDRRDRSRSRDRSHSRDRSSRDRDRDSKRNSRDRRRDSTSLSRDENSKDADDRDDMVDVPKLQPLLLPHLKLQQQQQLQQQQLQQQQLQQQFLQNDTVPYSHMQRAKTPAPMRTLGPVPLRGATPGLPTIPSTPSKMQVISSRERWDLPTNAHIIGNTQGNFKPLPALSQGIRPLQPSLDSSHLRDLDNRHHLGSISFPNDVLRPSLPLQSVGHNIGQTPFIKTESYRDVKDRENIILRGHESWQASPSRQMPEGSNRFPRNDRVGGYANPQDSFPTEEEYEANNRTDYDFHSSRGNFRGSMRGVGDFRRGFSTRGRGLGPGAGHIMQTRGFTPTSHNETERRNVSSYPSDRRGQPQMFGRLSRTDQNNFSKDRYDSFDRNHSNDRQFSGRVSGFANERYPKDRYSNERSYDHRQQNAVGMCVEIRNMPSQAGYIDIKRFFNGLHIGGRGIKLINDNHGNRVGIAYVRFFKPEHKEQALMLTGRPLCGSPVEVLHLNDEIFHKAIDSYIPVEEMDDEETSDALETFVCLTVSDVPSYTKEDDLNKLFHDFGVDEIILLMPNDQKQNMAFVKFSKPEDAKKAACSLVKPAIGHKLVTLTPCSLDQFQHAKKLKQDKQPSEPKERVQAAPRENAVISKAPADPRQREVPSDVVRREVPSDVPRREIPSDVPRQEVPSDFPRREVTSHVPRREVSSDVPRRNVPSDVPRREVPLDVPRREVPSDDPRREVSLDVPRREFPTDVPRREFPSAVPKREIPSDVPRQEVPSDVPRREVHSDVARRELPSDVLRREVSSAVPRPEEAKPPQIITDCILLKGLPDNANDRDILDFFSDVGLVPMRIHIMLDKFSKPTGDAFCEFSSPEEVVRAIAKHKMPLGKENVSVEAIPRTEMHEALGMTLPQPEPLLQQPLVSHGPRFQQPPVGRNTLSTKSVGLLGTSPSAPNRVPLLGRHLHSATPAQPQDIPVEGFGKPGCVLALTNVPFRAHVDEILDFFSDFEVTRENIIRRFNDKGTPTGDARVALSSPAEVERALHMLRFRKMRDRQIFLKPL
ncbi:hypothetical protein PR048_016007 [Dryococelus australis]|uniref:RRM domain-containing protein n=1 Tax=Dryococelus australis TaxID=614101 RepID=A0ABQ9HIP8_9NEOP|nr:hypothetical protein PR048_016007 [Dryococelus australis]